MVNNWLYVSCDTNWSPGAANSARITNASTPPNMKKHIEVTKYRLPITL